MAAPACTVRWIGAILALAAPVLVPVPSAAQVAWPIGPAVRAAAAPRFSVGQIVPGPAQTPRLLRPGSTVRITGAGLHAGAQVQFGNPEAAVTASAVDPAGTWLTAVVPPLASSGAVTVVQDGASVRGPALTIDNWRDVNGYSFCNTDKFQTMVGGYSFNDLTEVFGFDQTHLNIFGWRPEDPLAHAFLDIANKALQGGQCYGFSLSSLRMQAGQRQVAEFPSWNGVDANVAGPTKDIWHLNGPQMSSGVNSSPKLSHFVHLTHIQQFSAEFLAAYVANWNVLGSKDQFRNHVRAALAGGRGAVVTLGGNCSHAVQAYNLLDSPGGGYDVWVYDPNVQYLAGEADGSRTKVSRVQVSASGSYVYNDGGNGENCSGNLRDVNVVAFSSMPPNPHLPTLQGAISALTHLFGEGARVAQVTDASGRKLLGPDGRANPDAQTRIPNSAVFQPLGGLRGKAAAPVFVLGSKGPYTYSISGKSPAGYSIHLLGQGFAAVLDNVSSAAGAQDEVVVDHAGASVQFRTSMQQKPVSFTVHARAADGQVRSATLSSVGHAGALLHLGFDATREHLTYRHQGPVAPFTLQLQAAGAGKAVQTLRHVGATLQHGDEVVFSPDWADLSRGGALRLRRAGGAVEEGPLK